MKIFKTTAPITVGELKTFLDENLNALFEKQRQLVMAFDIVLDDNALEITNDENYDSFLFRIEVGGTKLHITKSEHYTDDINVLALEDIMYTLLPKFPGNKIQYVEGEN